MRKLLRVEAAGLLKGQAGHQKNFKVRMERIIKRLESDSDGVLLSELAEVRDELAAARRGLARLAIAEQPTLKLKNEWHDWVRHAHHSEGVDHEVRSERLEMLASELRLRGVEMPKIESSLSRSQQRPVAVEVKMESCVETPVAAEMLEEDEESDEVVAQHWDEIGQYWERLIGGLHTEHADPGQLARLFHAFREIQGERKRADRLAGVRRYRLGAFEAWH